MPTFLTTSKMHPALAARIEASVRGRDRGRKAGAPRLTPRFVSIARFALVLVVAVGTYAVVTCRQRDRREIERSRGALLDAVRAQGASLTAEERDVVSRAESWLTPLAGTYDDDVVADELRAPGAWKTTLARPAVYVRGPLGAFKSSNLIAEAAWISLAKRSTYARGIDGCGPAFDVHESVAMARRSH